MKRFAADGGTAPAGLSAVLIGGRALGELLVDHPRVPLVSATGSTAMGRAVGPRLAQRFARAILELGGNNAAIVCPSADLDLTLRGVAFAAMGTAGQRCTTLRRLFVHDSIYEALLPRLRRAYESVSVGSPLQTSDLPPSQEGEANVRRAEDDPDARHLRSAHELCGYHVQAGDGALGHVEDLLVDLQEWRVPAFALDTRNWLPGEKLVVETDLVTAIRHLERQVAVNATREDLRERPAYVVHDGVVDPTAP